MKKFYAFFFVAVIVGSGHYPAPLEGEEKGRTIESPE